MIEAVAAGKLFKVEELKESLAAARGRCPCEHRPQKVVGVTMLGHTRLFLLVLAELVRRSGLRARPTLPAQSRQAQGERGSALARSFDLAGFNQAARKRPARRAETGF